MSRLQRLIISPGSACPGGPGNGSHVAEPWRAAFVQPQVLRFARRATWGFSERQAAAQALSEWLICYMASFLERAAHVVA